MDIYKIKDEFENRLERSKNGYSKSDLWNFDEHLAKIIKEGCFILADIHNGYPAIFDKDSDEVANKKWKQILLDISFGFGSYLEMRSGEYKTSDKEFKRLENEFNNGLKLFTKYFTHLWD
jgi:hypothetical protein